MSLPYVEPGVRLIRRDQIDAFDGQLIALRSDLDAAVLNLQAHYSEIMSAAQQQLGTLYNPADYPPYLEGLFQFEWDYPSLEAPDYLQRLNPVLYEQECARVAARFDETVVLAEQGLQRDTAGATMQSDAPVPVFVQSKRGNFMVARPAPKPPKGIISSPHPL